MLIFSLKKVECCDEHNFAHSILNNALSIYGIDYKSETIEKGEYGKPYLANHRHINYNLTHADGITACFIHKGNSVGIDAEKVKKLRKGVLRRSFSQLENEFIEKSENPNLDFYRIWTLKESYVKAIGIGVSYPLHTVEFDLNGNEIKCSKKDCTFQQVILQGKYVISVCKM